MRRLQFVLVLCVASVGLAEEPSVDGEAADTEAKQAPLPVDPTWIRLSKDDRVWVDKKRKTVIVGAEICNHLATLEMFACPARTKEYESLIAVHSRARVVHTALLAIGATTGGPAQFDPEYVPASGSEIEVTVVWMDDQGNRQRIRAQEWVRELTTGKPMTHEWVFAGSGFSEPYEDEEPYYLAESGDLICVSNFSTAMMDLTVSSSQSDGGLLFEVFTERVPPVGTPVQLELTPKPANDKD